jgi:hypothetical protein
MAAVGLVAVVAVWLRFWPLMSAFVRYVPVAPTDALLLLAPGNAGNLGEWRMSRLLVNVLLLAFGAGGVLIYRSRKKATRSSAVVMVLPMAIFGFIVLMHVLPYRIMYGNEAERVEFEGARCYLIGQSTESVVRTRSSPADDGILFCPDRPAPRNRRVDMQSPDLHRSGIFESIFTPAR